MNVIEKAVELLQRELGDLLLSVDSFRGQTTVSISAQGIVQACRMLQEDADLRFNFLAALTAADDLPDEPRYRVIYQLYSLPNAVFLRLSVPLASQDPHVPTVEGVFPNANWHEREVYDMFGITFDNHSDLRRILMPADWEGHPLRKDYPLGYEEVQFSFNYEEIARRKPFAEE